ncbi:MAG: ParB N-terminal domain-containing protein [Pseudomonadota bacterium]
MLATVTIALDQIYVPVKLRKTFDQAKLEARADGFLKDEAQPPIQVRRGEGRYVLVRGLHRLEAARALGEATVEALIVAPRRG